MSKLIYSYKINETVLDNDDDFVEDYETNLPHGDELLAHMCKDWNDMNMHRFYDGVLENKIASAVMYPCIKTNANNEKEYIGRIEFVGAPKVRFTQKIRDEIINQTDAQFSDGWGESFFGYANIMTMSDGTHVIAE